MEQSKKPRNGSAVRCDVVTWQPRSDWVTGAALRVVPTADGLSKSGRPSGSSLRLESPASPTWNCRIRFLQPRPLRPPKPWLLFDASGASLKSIWLSRLLHLPYLGPVLLPDAPLPVHILGVFHSTPLTFYHSQPGRPPLVLSGHVPLGSLIPGRIKGCSDHSPAPAGHRSPIRLRVLA